MLSLRKSLLTKWQFTQVVHADGHLSQPCWTLNLADDRFSQANWGHRLHTRDEYSDRHGQHLLVYGGLSAAWVSYLSTHPKAESLFSSLNVEEPHCIDLGLCFLQLALGTANWSRAPSLLRSLEEFERGRTHNCKYYANRGQEHYT